MPFFDELQMSVLRERERKDLKWYEEKLWINSFNTLKKQWKKFKKYILGKYHRISVNKIAELQPVTLLTASLTIFHSHFYEASKETALKQMSSWVPSREPKKKDMRFNKENIITKSDIF